MVYAIQMSQEFRNVIGYLSLSDFLKQIPPRNTLSTLFFFLHSLVAEHTAINFQPIARARTACTKTFCINAQRLGLVEKK